MGTQIVSFSNVSSDDQKHLKNFVKFQREFYRSEPRAIPLLRYEYLGSRLLGMKGFFERRNSFYKHGDSQFFLAYRGDEIVGRVCAFIDENHNRHWKAKVGFIGQFECINDVSVARELLTQAEHWLRDRGMSVVRGPQNFPMNEATPGVLVEGYDSRPVVYYHFNHPYYAKLLKEAGYAPVKSVLSWEISVQDNGIEKSLEALCQKIVKRYDIRFELWGERSLQQRKKEMFEVYNEAWSDNFGFVPFEREEFYSIINDMQLVMDKALFLFVYSRGELAGFFGGVPNIFESLVLKGAAKRVEFLRALKLIFNKSKVTGFRLGYLGVKKKYQKMGLDGVMLWRQSQIAKQRGYQYCDMGWVLEDNRVTVQLIERCGAVPSKKYTIFEKSLIHG